MADNTDNKKSSSLEDRFKQNLYSLAQIGNQGIDKSKEIKEDYKKFGKDAVQLPGQLARNRAERDAIMARESKSSALTQSQKEQLKNISNADDAQRFVDASILGNENGDYGAGQSIYKESLKSGGKAIGEFAVNAATLPVGGAVAKSGVKAGAAAIERGAPLFKSAAEAVGSKLPSLKKYSDVFKSEADITAEKVAAEKIRREAAREAKREEIRANATRPKNNNIENTAKNESAAEQTSAIKAEKNNIDPWTGEKVKPPKPPKPPKTDTTANKPSLFSSFMGGAKKAVIPSIVAGEYYDGLSDEEKKEWQDKAQQGLNAAGDFAGEAINNPNGLLEKGEKILSDGADSASDLASTAGAVGLGAYVGSSGNPFKGMASGIVGGIGGLFASNNSSEAALSSMPSGGDSGITGETHFGSDDMSGKSAVEILNKIYGVLSRIYDVSLTISRDTKSLVRSGSAQDAARDLSSANLSARANEGGSAYPMFSSGGGGGGGAGEEKENGNKGFFASLLEKLNGGKAGNIAKAAASAIPGGKILGKVGGALVKNRGNILKGVGIAGTAAVLTSGDSDGSDKALYAKKFFMDKGYTEEQAAGIVGNLQGESGNFNKDVISGERRGDGGKAVGIAQWHPERQAKFKEVMGKDLVGSSYEDQLEFINWELNNSHKNAGDDLKKQTTAAAAAKSVEGKYEITAASMHGGHSPERVRNAEKLMGKSLPDKKETSSAKPEINGTKLTGDTKRNPYFGQETTPFEENDEVTTKTVSGGGVTTKTAPEYVKTDLDKAVEAHEQDPLNNPDPLASVHSKIKPQGYLEAKDADLEKRRNKVEADMKANKITTDEANAKYDDINREQNNNEWDKMEKADAATATASPVKNDTTTKPDNGKSQVDLLNATVDQMNSTKYEMLDEDEATVRAKQQKFYSENPTATPVKNDDSEEQIAEIDRQKATLENERNEIGQSGVNVDKQTMDAQLDRLSDIHTEMSSLNEQRNNLSGGQPKQSSVAPQQTQQAAAPPAPASPAGSAKSVPNVRNDDPTIKMMEEGNMWRTTSHDA